MKDERRKGKPKTKHTASKEAILGCVLKSHLSSKQQILCKDLNSDFK